MNINLLVMIKIRSHILFKTIALKSEVKVGLQKSDLPWEQILHSRRCVACKNYWPTKNSRDKNLIIAALY